MRKCKYRLAHWLLVAIAFAITVIFLGTIRVSAEDGDYCHPTPRVFEDSTGEHDTSDAHAVNIFCYGEKSIGKMYISGGATKKNDDYHGFIAYSSINPLRIGYSFSDKYQTDTKENWNIDSDSGKTAGGISLSKKISDGAFVVQRSKDGHNWEDATEPIFGFFSSKKTDYDNLLSISQEDLIGGTYYRIIIAYKMRQKIGEESIVLGIKTDKFDERYCTEVYQFFVYYGGNPIVVRSLKTGEEISPSTEITEGFSVSKMGSCDSVLVKRNKGASVYVDSAQSFYEEGKYEILVTDPLGDTFSFNVSVTDGLSMMPVSPAMYENEKKKEYTEDNLVDGTMSFGARSHTSLKIAHNSSSLIAVSSRNSVAAYGVKGSGVYLFLNLVNNDVMNRDGWEILSDDWGKKDSQLVDGVHVGQVGSGALIIQTSPNGVSWENVDYGRYANGVFTTDYEHYYGNHGDVLIYMPNGQDVLNGIYIRVIYAYEAKNAVLKADNRYIEKYEFYLCSNELDAVTFHNLSVSTSWKDILGDEEYDDTTAEVYKQAETLLSGSYTTAGFRIDTTLNPTVSFAVKRDGDSIAIPSNHEFTASGKYEIVLTSAVNEMKTVYLFVDRMSAEEALEFYFGASLIEGKRIYSEGEYPSFEGGLTSYHLNSVDQNHLPVRGIITNQTTGETIEIPALYKEQSGDLFVPGLYEGRFETDGRQESGDKRVITFRFEIIPEGSATGPKVNQKSLYEYAHSTITDSYPIYYSLMYPSATAGYITLAFATHEAAKEYAYNYEKGMVELQADGTYRYIGSFLVTQKETYDSAWDLTDAMYYFAEQAVQTGHFDLSDEFTTLTLKDSLIDNTWNLRTLELAKSVTIFATGQRSELTSLDALPIIGLKPYSFLVPGSSGNVERGFSDFEFIRDKYGCDSDKVLITDCNGKEYSISYRSGVAAQLAAQNCPSGLIEIREQTIYGDTVSYQAVYIAQGENTAALKLSYDKDDKEQTITITQQDADEANGLEVEAFSVKEILDSLDPFCLITVSSGGKICSFAADQIPDEKWAVPGVYQIKVVNRLGASFLVDITVVESDYATISFSGEGTENTQEILTTYGASHIKLPELSLYGYKLTGYKDQEGNIYSDEIATILFKGAVVLEAVWQAKQYTLTLQDPEGQTINTMIIDYGVEYELPTPELSKEYVFAGWTLNGKSLETNTLTLKTEGDVILVASATKTEESDTQKNEATNPEKEKGVPVLPIAIGAVILAIIGTVVFLGVKSKTKKNSQKTNRQKNESMEDGNE